MTSKSENNSIIDSLTDFDTNVGSTERIVSAIAGGALLTYGIKRSDTVGVLLSVLGGSLILRGATGHCQVYDVAGINTSEETSHGKKGLLSGNIDVAKSLTINKPPSELFQFWRNFGNLPQFMEHLESVQVIDSKRSHWKAKAPLGYSVEWDAEITNEEENVRIEWSSVEGSEIPNSGVVEFLPTSTRGTVVKVSLNYEAPGGYLGAMFAKLFGEEPSQQVYGDLYRFKSLMESGEIITTEGQTSGREPQAKKATA